MSFKKGKKLPRQGGQRGNRGGRPTNEERDFRAAIREAIDREAKWHALAIGRIYIQRAMSGKAELRHLVDKAVENAKQTIEHQGGVEVRRVTVRTIDPDEGGRHGEK